MIKNYIKPVPLESAVHCTIEHARILKPFTETMQHPVFRTLYFFNGYHPADVVTSSLFFTPALINSIETESPAGDVLITCWSIGDVADPDMSARAVVEIYNESTKRLRYVTLIGIDELDYCALTQADWLEELARLFAI